jgi:hypothetical protein
MNTLSKIVIYPAVVALAACGGGEDSAATSELTDQGVNPERLEVQHILISFEGRISKPGLTRSQEEAEALANELLEKISEGEDFDNLVQTYTDDQYPGIYKMANLDVPVDEEAGEYPRGRMVKGFGDVSFSLKVGEVGMCGFDAETSPYGWHIVKRLK